MGVRIGRTGWLGEPIANGRIEKLVDCFYTLPSSLVLLILVPLYHLKVASLFTVQINGGNS